jgi:uncharacterized protein (TIGR00251 family)
MDRSPEPVKAHESGTLLTVHVTPRARESRVVGILKGRVEVRVRSAPEKGRANGECLSVLAAALGTAKSRLELVRGGAGREKLVLVRGLAPEEVLARLGSNAKVRQTTPPP